MSSFLYKYLLKKTGLAHTLNIGASAEGDPYTEPIPADELKFYQRRGAKRKRKIPEFLSSHDQNVLKAVRDRAHLLDLSFGICGIRFGLSGIIGLIPWVGDVIACLSALWLIRKASQVDGGIPDSVKVKMTTNVMMDFGIGLIPIVGDFINIAYKANTRNFQLLEKFLYEKYQGQNLVPIETQKPDFRHLGGKNNVY